LLTVTPLARGQNLGSIETPLPPPVERTASELPFRA
jgi:hypothetical protein